MLRKIQTAEFQLQKIQDNVELALKEIEIKPFMNGVMISNVRLLAGQDNIVNHGLKIVPIGWAILRKNATGDVWDSATVNPRPELSLILKSSVNLTVSIWIF